ncbi:inositol monophosphatase [Pelagibacteraceae bacterium]|nr:inositol monophosphatase [Pelagibacteraceae bacterium]
MSYSSPHINTMLTAARKAGKKLVRDFGEVENLQVSIKGVSNFVSAADIQSEKILINELSRAYPDYDILAEEAGEIKNSKNNNPLKWIIDPLDGTTNFLFGIPHFAISIALQKNGQTLSGIVYNPITDDLFWAVKGKGAFCNNKRLRVSVRERFDSCTIGTGIPHKGLKDHEEYLLGLTKIMENAAAIRRFGTASLDLVYVAAGKFDGFWEKNLKIWDIAAGALIVTEAGGRVTDFRGMNEYLESGNIVSSNFKIHDELLRLIKI